MPERHPRRADFIPDSSFFALDNEGVSRWFSCLKNASMSACDRACKLRNSFMVSAAFAFAVPNLLGPLLRLAGGRLLALKLYIL